MTAMTMMMTTTLTVTEMLKVFVISFVGAIVFKILARTTLVVKVDFLKRGYRCLCPAGFKDPNCS